MEDCEEKICGSTMYGYMKIGYLCDATLMAYDGKQFLAHAGILAAASSLLENKLTTCASGIYLIGMPLNPADTEAFIEFAYTGKRVDPISSSFKNLEQFCDKYDEASHDKWIVSRLRQFAEKGLFCNMAWYSMAGDVSPAHSFLMASRFAFLAQYIRRGSFVSVLEYGEKIPMIEKQDLKGETVYLCDLCDRIYTDCESLEAHKRSHDGYQAIVCPVCNKVFVMESHLKCHMKIHSGLKPFTCDICNKDFTQRGNMNKHRKLHSGEKMFPCLKCDKKYSQKQSLQRHQNVHQREPFNCVICNKQYKRKSALLKHQYLHIASVDHNIDQDSF